MIAYLKGKIVYKNDKSIILENQGIGYRIFVSPKTNKLLPLEKEVKIFTFLHFSKDIMELYGFLTKEEFELFEILNEISGIGPKTATLLASFGSLEQLKRILEREEIPIEIKGIGKKKTQRILLELTGKIQALARKKTIEKDPALEALISLGFSRQIAKEALARIPKEIIDTEQKIKEALKILGRRG